MSHMETRGGATRTTRTMRSRENTMTAAGPGFLGTRFESSAVPLPWKAENELSPVMVVENEDGEERIVNEGDYYAGPKEKSALAASETGKSDGASSIFLVFDHGFVAASELFVGRVGSEGPEMPQQIMCVDKLRDHLGLERKERCSVADTVSEKLDKSLVTSVMDPYRPLNEQDGKFLPVDRLYEILNIATILSLVKELFPDATHSELCKRVADITGSHEGTLGGKCRRRILAILLFCGRLDETALNAFIDGEVWDEDLPLRRRDNDPGSSPHWCSTTTNPDYINRTLLESWKRTDLKLFYAYQPDFHAPFFDLQEDRLCSYEFPKHVRLPWQSFKKVADGGGGTVYRIEIHPGHHNYGKYSENSVAFALKKISSPEGESYKQELIAHEKACAKLQKGEHIIKLLLTYEHDGHHYLMFEWADGALVDFWERRLAKDPPQAEKWAAEQCYGLATALKQIHGLATWQAEKREAAKQDRDLSLGPTSGDDPDKAADWGIHGDIKPKNILWFSRYRDRKDHLVISDLGLTRYHSEFSRSKMAASKIDGFSEAYRPPELDLDNKNISRRSDVWSLGCVFLEFCVWYLEGIDGVERFEQQREKDDKSDIRGLTELKFFILGSVPGSGERIASVKPSVKRRLAEAHTIKSPFVRQMLGIIDTKMLRIESAERENIDKISTAIDELKKNTEIQHPTPPSPTIPAPASEDPLFNAEIIVRRTTEVESAVKYARGNADSAYIESQFEAAKRPHALSLRTMGSNISANNSQGNPHTNTDEKGDNGGNDDTPETQPDGHEFSQRPGDVEESQCLPTQTPLTTMDNSEVLESDAHRGRRREIQEVLEKVESIVPTPPSSAPPVDDTGRPDTPKKSQRTREAIPAHQVSEIEVAVPKEDVAPQTSELLQVTQNAELLVSKTVQTTNTTNVTTAEMPQTLERASTLRGSRRSSVIRVPAEKTQRVYQRVRVFIREKVFTKLRSG